MEISIVMPMYNGEKTIKKTLDNLYKQTFDNFELIIIDDGSTDDSVSIVNKYISYNKINNIKLLSINNSGVSIARNVGISISTGKYIIFLDSDDFFKSNMLEDMFNNLESTGADICISGFEYLYDDNIRNKLMLPLEGGLYNSDNFIKKQLISLYDNKLINCVGNKMYKSNLIKDNNILFRKNYNINEDLIFAIETIDKAKMIYINKNYYYMYYQHDIGKSLVFKYNDNGIDTCIDFMNVFVSYYEKYDLEYSLENELKNRIIMLFLYFLDKVRKNKNLSFKKKIYEFNKIYKSKKFIYICKNTNILSKKVRIKVNIIIYRLYLLGIMLK